MTAIGKEPLEERPNVAAREMEREPYLVIEPPAGWRSLRLREIWEFRDLLVALGLRDVKLIYKQTALGITWVVLQPLIGAMIFAFVFGQIATLPSEGTSYFVLAFAGMVGWTLFSTAVTGSSLAMVNNAALVSKIFFPRLILPLAAAFQPAVNLVVGIVVLILLLILQGSRIGWELLLLPAAAGSLLALAVGLGFWSSAVMVRYRDLKFVVPVAVQFLLYASPVGYSISAVESKVPAQYHFAYMLNPLASLIEFFRWTLIGEGTLHAGWLTYSLLITVGIFVGGAYAFRRAERSFADVI